MRRRSESAADRRRIARKQWEFRPSRGRYPCAYLRELNWVASRAPCVVQGSTTWTLERAKLIGQDGRQIEPVHERRRKGHDFRDRARLDAQHEQRREPERRLAMFAQVRRRRGLAVG